MVAAFSFQAAELPDGLRFDGVMEGDGRFFLQFTELDKSRKSYGASFYIDSCSVLLNAIIARREEKRIEFAHPPQPLNP
jgi:hypothetical protein